MYLGALTLSYLAMFPLSKIIMKSMKDTYKGTTSYDVEAKLIEASKTIYQSIAFVVCCVVVCGSTTFAVWYGIPWLNTLVAAAVIPAWLLLTHSISSGDEGGRQTSTTHEAVHIRTGVRRGPVSERQAYEHKHGEGSWRQKVLGERAIVKWFFFLAFVGGLVYFGFYEAIGVLVVTAGLRAFSDR